MIFNVPPLIILCAIIFQLIVVDAIDAMFHSYIIISVVQKMYEVNLDLEDHVAIYLLCRKERSFTLYYNTKFKLGLVFFSVSWTVFLYCYLDFPRRLARLNSTGGTTEAIWVAIKKYSLNIFSSEWRSESIVQAINVYYLLTP